MHSNGNINTASPDCAYCMRLVQNPLNNYVTKWKYRDDPPRAPKPPKKPKVPRTVYHFPLSSFSINTSSPDKVEKSPETEASSDTNSKKDNDIDNSNSSDKDKPANNKKVPNRTERVSKQPRKKRRTNGQGAIITEIQDNNQSIIIAEYDHSKSDSNNSSDKNNNNNSPNINKYTLFERRDKTDIISTTTKSISKYGEYGDNKVGKDGNIPLSTERTHEDNINNYDCTISDPLFYFKTITPPFREPLLPPIMLPPLLQQIVPKFSAIPK